MRRHFTFFVSWVDENSSHERDRHNFPNSCICVGTKRLEWNIWFNLFLILSTFWYNFLALYDVNLLLVNWLKRGRSPLFRIGNYDKNCEEFGLCCYCTGDSIHVWTKLSQFMAITCIRRHRHSPVPGGDKINSENIIVIFWDGFWI